MSKVTTTRLVDDIDGSEAITTVTFTWDEVPYEIDLSKKNDAALKSVMAPYLGAARKAATSATRAATTPTARKVRIAAPGIDLTAIRSWAQENGYPVADRGRIARTVVEAFNAAQSAPAPAAVEAPVAPSAPAKKSPLKRAARKATAAISPTKKTPAKRGPKRLGATVADAPAPPTEISGPAPARESEEATVGD